MTGGWEVQRQTKSGLFPGGPVVKNLPSNAGDAGSSPGRGTKIPHAKGQLSLHTSTREALVCYNWRKPAHLNY